MQKHEAKDIRNIAVLGHSGSGKTSFCEAVLFRGGITKRVGSVTEGNTVMDYSPEEKKRQISINMGVSSVEWQGAKVNLIDTPGDFDFMGEVNQALRVADSAIVVLSGKSGVTVGAEKSFRFLKRENIPYAIFINKMDDEVADFNKVLVEIREEIGRSATVMMLPFKSGNSYDSYVDILAQKAYTYNNPSGEREEIEIPEDLIGDVELQRAVLIEQVAESSEELLEKYFMDEPFTEEEIKQGLRERISTGKLIPIWAGSALALQGIRFSMNRIVQNMPSPVDMPIEPAIKSDGTALELKTDPNGPLAAMVFKTYTDPYVGKISLFRVYSGTIKPGQDLWNAKQEASERVSGVFTPNGSQQVNASEITAGDIGLMTKLDNTFTGDTLSTKDQSLVLPRIILPASPLRMAIYPVNKGEEDKIALGIARIQEEDPTIKLEMDNETGEMIVSGLGELQLNVLIAKLLSNFKVEARLESPRVAYREKLQAPVKVQGKYKKQSGGHGQYGDVWIEFSPHEETDLIFEEDIFGGAVPKSYFPAVEKGLREAIEEGPLAGYPVVGLKAVLVDGSYHDVDSSELAFSMAAKLAYKAAMEQGGVYLLEPVYNVEVHVPEADLGEIMSDISKRTGRINGIDQKAGMSIVSALIPLGAMDRYATDLRAMTQGRGWYSMEFSSYERVPHEFQEKLIAKYQESKEN